MMDSKLYITISEGFGAILLSMLDILPEILRIAIICVTLLHIIVRVKRELKEPAGKFYFHKSVAKKKPTKKKKKKKKSKKR